MASETIRVINEPICRQPIDLKQGGQFIEPLCNLIPSMIAQQVASGSFEEEPPYHVAYKKDLDRPHRPWYPDGAVHAAEYSYDTEQPFNGKRCQKIAIRSAYCRAGISQDGFYTHEGVQYRLRFHVRSDTKIPIWASLHGGGGPIAGPVPLGFASESWTPVETLLAATRTMDNATLTIEADGPGTIWLDRVSLIGDDAVLGIWRPDVVEALRAMNPGVIRWGGSTTEGYEWTECIGPWDTRAPFTTIWGGLEPNFVGMEEFAQLCRFIGAEPLLCIRWSGKQPSDAAAQVEYFNRAGTHWGDVRADNGHPEPYGVKYWQIGNEVGGEGYDASVRAFAEAMKATDPSIKICSAFLTDQTLAKGGDYLDYLCPHHYGCADLAGKAAEFAHLREQIARDAHGRDVRVAVTEWNTTAGDWGLGRGTLQTLSNALSCARYQNLMHRNADLVEMAIRSNLVDSFGSGVIQTGPGWMYLAPTYYAQQLYQRAAGGRALRIERAQPGQPHEQTPDLSAVLSGDGKTLRVYAVNPGGDAIGLVLQLEGFRGTDRTNGTDRTDGTNGIDGTGADGNEATLTVLSDGKEALTAEVMNSRDAPLRIVPSSETIVCGLDTCEFSCAPYSLSLVEIGMRR